MNTELTIIKNLPRKRYEAGHSLAGKMRNMRVIARCDQGHKKEMEASSVARGCRTCLAIIRDTPVVMPRQQPNEVLRLMEGCR